VRDRGCGDGTFTSMLEAAGVAERVEFGADYVARRHPRGRRFAGHVVRADARRLPFKSGALGSVVANGVLSSIAWKEEGETDAYERQVARREAHDVVLDEATWRRKLGNAGWEVERVQPFLTPRQTRWFGVLRAQPLRAMNLLRVIPLAGIRRVVMGLEERLFRALARTGPAIPDPSARRAGFLLIIARKRHVSVPS
jgi:methyltransferase family protein